MGRKRRKHSKVAESPVTFGMVSLGCPKNLIDSEKIAANLLEGGFVLCQDETEADVVIVNTCSFIAPAREESLSVIRKLAARRRSGGLRALVVVGCMAQQERGKLLDAHPEVDAAVSFSAYTRCAELVRKALDTGERFFVGGISRRLAAETGRLLLSGPHSAYLRIAEGCSNHCTFCTIPAIRGPFRSKPPEAVLEETKELVGFGVREIVIIAQDTTSYGADLKEGTGLAQLLSSVAGIDGIGWLRLMYANPAKVTDKLIGVIAETPAVVRYLDMPIQHISDTVLRRMGRRHGEKATRRLVSRLHERIGSLALRTTLLVGFPGETDEDFEKLLEFVREGHFQRLGVFTYSKEKGTATGRMKKTVLHEVALERRERLMLAQQQVAFEFAKGLVGKQVDVLVETECAKRSSTAQRSTHKKREEDKVEQPSAAGRTYMDAPEIDGRAIIRASDVEPGQIVGMRVVDTDGYDLIVRKG